MVGSMHRVFVFSMDVCLLHVSHSERALSPSRGREEGRAESPGASPTEAVRRGGCAQGWSWRMPG